MTINVWIFDVWIIVLGLAMAILGVQCARLEERECLRLPRECAALGPALFDGYRALSVAGATSVLVGLTNLLMRSLSDGGGLSMPHGVSISYKVGAIFFLAVRWRRYVSPDHYGWQNNLLTKRRRGRAR